VERIFPNVFYKVSVIPIQKPDKDFTRKENCIYNSSYKYKYKNPQESWQSGSRDRVPA
jgi:hypothetical protein